MNIIDVVIIISEKCIKVSFFVLNPDMEEGRKGESIIQTCQTGFIVLLQR